MPVYSSFLKKTEEELTTFLLKKNCRKKLENFLIANGVECYLTADQLNEINTIADPDERREELLSVYLPEKGAIKSGDFGEILSYFLILQEHSDRDLQIIAPKKWIWKEDKNKAASQSDAIMFLQEDQNSPSPNDKVITIESKMAATKPKKDVNRIQDAIDGALDDKATRMARTISWLYSRYAKELNHEKKNYIKRFKNPVDNPYKKECYAIAIIDSVFFNAQKEGEFESEGLKVYAISISKLKDMYEQFFEEVANA